MHRRARRSAQPLDRMKGLYVVSFEALPLPGTDAADSYRGAFINVYTDGTSEAAALEIASREIEAAGWKSKSIEKLALVTRQDFEEGSQGLQYFEQALIDGTVVVVHAVSAAADEDDVARIRAAGQRGAGAAIRAPHRSGCEAGSSIRAT